MIKIVITEGNASFTLETEAVELTTAVLSIPSILAQLKGQELPFEKQVKTGELKPGEGLTEEEIAIIEDRRERQKTYNDLGNSMKGKIEEQAKADEVAAELERKRKEEEAELERQIDQEEAAKRDQRKKDRKKRAAKRNLAELEDEDDASEEAAKRRLDREAEQKADEEQQLNDEIAEEAYLEKYKESAVATKDDKKRPERVTKPIEVPTKEKDTEEDKKEETGPGAKSEDEKQKLKDAKKEAKAEENKEGSLIDKANKIFKQQGNEKGLIGNAIKEVRALFAGEGLSNVEFATLIMTECKSKDRVWNILLQRKAELMSKFDVTSAEADAIKIEVLKSR